MYRWLIENGFPEGSRFSARHATGARAVAGGAACGTMVSSVTDQPVSREINEEPLFPVSQATEVVKAMIVAARPEDRHMLWSTWVSALSSAKEESKVTGEVLPWEDEDTITAITFLAFTEAVRATILAALPETEDIPERRGLARALAAAYDKLDAMASRSALPGSGSRPAPGPVRAENLVQGSDQQGCSPGRPPVMITRHVLRFVFLLIMRVAAWLRLSRREDAWKTAQILILSHQLTVLQRRRARRPRLNWADRALLAALLGVLPKARRRGLRLVVTRTRSCAGIVTSSAAAGQPGRRRAGLADRRSGGTSRP